MFHHSPLVWPSGVTKSDTEFRYYTTPSGAVYPSITSVQSWAAEKGLEGWRNWVGEDKAERIKNRTASRGGAIHKMCEALLRNDIDPEHGHMPINKVIFRTMRPKIERHIGTVFGLEEAIYSDLLTLGGTTDAVCEWDHVPSVVDFKTKDKPKKSLKVYDKHFVQAAAYAIMVEELTGKKIDQLVVFMGFEDGTEPLALVRQRKDFIHDLHLLIKSYRSAVADGMAK